MPAGCLGSMCSASCGELVPRGVSLVRLQSLDGPQSYLWTACRCFCFFNDTATTEIYTLSLHDALPISKLCWATRAAPELESCRARLRLTRSGRSEEHTSELQSPYVISYAVFCLKK